MPRLPFVVAFVALVTTSSSTVAWEAQETRLSLGGGSPVLTWVPQGVRLIPGGRGLFQMEMGELRLGDSLGGAPEDDEGLGLSLSHALTPNLYVAGTAAAAAPRSTSDRSSVLFGASIGLRF